MSETTPPSTPLKRGRAKPWKPGQSGNPAGRPKGARHKTTLAMEALLDGEADTITRKAVEMAKGGDMVAIRLCLERIVPARRDRPVSFALPKLETAGDAVKATAAIVEAVSLGDLTPSEAAELAKLVDGFRSALTTAELEERLAKLEAANDR
jgi:Family of unknown function (DUF5681)